MSNCPIDLSFSKTHSNKRVEKAYKSLGVKIVTRIIGFTLFCWVQSGRISPDIYKCLWEPFCPFSLGQISTVFWHLKIEGNQHIKKL